MSCTTPACFSTSFWFTVVPTLLIFLKKLFLGTLLLWLSLWLKYNRQCSALGSFMNQASQLCSILCYAALLKNFAYYSWIMLIDIEQLPDIYSSIPMYCLQIYTFIGKWYISEIQITSPFCETAFYREDQYTILQQSASWLFCYSYWLFY